MSFVYLGSPYSHPDPIVMEQRFQDACAAAGYLMRRGEVVFAPICHSHPIASTLDPSHPTDHDFWMAQDLPFLKLASRLHILMLDGWRDSKGIGREIQYAFDHGIAITFMDWPLPGR